MPECKSESKQDSSAYLIETRRLKRTKGFLDFRFLPSGLLEKITKREERSRWTCSVRDGHACPSDEVMNGNTGIE